MAELARKEIGKGVTDIIWGRQNQKLLVIRWKNMVG